MAEVTNDRLYELINTTRLELKGDIRDVRVQFENLESGRITKLEDEVNRLRVKDATLNTKVYALVFIISSAVSALMTAVALKLLGSSH